ncbi:ABC transporter permease [Bauldia sp.]|uniref:ABC transporter permease n=1 Tax=Bauldia sp. TaxID=2575872 RepID=UPI003BAD2D4C
MTTIEDREQTMGAAGKSPAPAPTQHTVRSLLQQNRLWLGTLAFFLVLLAIFIVINPQVFLNPAIYRSIMLTVPIAIFLVVPAVFVVTAGEIDLSFPSVMGLSAWAFAIVVQSGYDPFLGMLACIALGSAMGFAVGGLVVYGNLSSLVATLGMNFLLRGLIMIISGGRSIAVPELRETTIHSIVAGRLFDIPMQMIWAVAFVIFCAFLYNRHRFGAHVHHVGDNPDSAEQMGISTRRVRVSVFAFMGLGASLAGIVSLMINFTWWPTTGEGFLLVALAALFVGGTPAWGGIGTVIGGAIGAVIVSFMETGVVAAGMDGFFVQFFSGLIIILALLGHRFHGGRVR